MPERLAAALRRHKAFAVPVFAALVAGGVVAGVSMGTGSTPARRTLSLSASRLQASQPATTSPLPAMGLALQQAFVQVVQSVSPSVVQIQDGQGLGSGIVLDNAGDIVTNNHVVAGGSLFTVTTSDGHRYDAQLVGSFPADDLAVIRAPAGHLQPARFADSSKLQVGDIAVAIGNPLGLRSSVTEGIVSAFRQAVPEPGGVTLPSAIQTSAAINPGNSGGALVDLEGRVIGIPTLAALDAQLGGGSAPGIGFAIPSNLVTEIARQIVAHGKVVDSHRAYLGIEVGDTNGQGVVVASITTGGPAAKAGVRVGDVIVSVAGDPTPTVSALTSVLSQFRPGKQVDVVVEHQSGTRLALHIQLGTLPGS